MQFSYGNVEPYPPPFGLGSAGIGNLHEAISVDQTSACLARGVERGLFYRDTARFYGLGLSQTRMGRRIRKNPGPSHDIQTKVGRVLRPTAPNTKLQHGFVDPLTLEPVFDFSCNAIERSVKQSSSRLNADYFAQIFLYDLGICTYGTDAIEHCHVALSSGLDRLQKRRTNRRISANEASILNDALETGRFDTLLLASRYSLFEHERSLNLINACIEAGIEIVIGGPINSGPLTIHLYTVSKFDYAAALTKMHERPAYIWNVYKVHGVPASGASISPTKSSSWPSTSGRTHLRNGPKCQEHPGLLDHRETIQSLDWLIDDVPNPQSLPLWLDVDGQGRQDGNTKTMNFSVPHVISRLSRFMGPQALAPNRNRQHSLGLNS